MSPLWTTDVRFGDRGCPVPASTMTSAPVPERPPSDLRRRELGRLRGRKHRALHKRGMGVCRVEVHKQRLIEALQDWGMPDHLTGRHDLVTAAVGDRYSNGESMDARSSISKKRKAIRATAGV
jgi:hypothetical protein